MVHHVVIKTKCDKLTIIPQYETFSAIYAHFQSDATGRTTLVALTNLGKHKIYNFISQHRITPPE